MFAMAGVMQGVLLVMCIAWKFRQRRLGIDDFGHPLDEDEGELESPVAYTDSTQASLVQEAIEDDLNPRATAAAVNGSERDPLIGSRRPKKKAWRAWFSAGRN